MMFMSLNSNMTEATSRVRTTYPTGVNPQFLVGSYISIFSFLCIVLWTIQFLMLFILAIALSVLWFMDSDYAFVILKQLLFIDV
jgi:hypothetical protein